MGTTKASGLSMATSGGLKQVMKRHPLFFFFFISYAGTWIIITPYVLSVWGILPGDYSIGYILKPFAGPTLAAIIMTGITEGKAGLLNLRNRLKQHGARRQWYLFSLLGIPALLLLGIIVQPGTLASFQGLTPTLLVTYPLYFFIVFFGVALPEEIGWRGFALPIMQPRYGPLMSSLYLGVLWSFWHFLFFLTPAHGGGPGTSFATLLTDLFIFTVMVVAFAIIFTWVFNNTGGSVFIANLLHTSIDAPQLVWIPLFPVVGETSLNIANIIGFVVPALLIVILTHGELGYVPSKGNLETKKVRA
jgi:membrane protease YdiL (CAAX protease family)